MHPKIKSQKGEGKLIPPIPFSVKHKQPGPRSREITGSDLGGDFPCAGPPAARRPAGRKCTPEHQKKMAKGALQSKDAFAPLQVPQSRRATAELKSPDQPAKASEPSAEPSAVPPPACHSSPLSMGTVIL